MPHSLKHPHKTRRGKLRRVLLLLGNYYQQNHLGIARFAREARWSLDISHMRTGEVYQHADRLDGIIGLITHQRDLDTLRRLPKVPLVDISAAWGTEALPDQGGRAVPRVLYDNAGIARLAAEHFIGRGFKHIAQLNLGNYYMERERRSVFRATIEGAGRVFHELEYYQWLQQAVLTATGSAEARAMKQLAGMLRKLPKPLAVFTSGDEIGVKVLLVCEEIGLGVPEEVAVLGCHNDPLICEFAPVPLSSVDDNLELQGYEAARLLEQLMDHGPAPDSPVIIPAEGVVTRASTDILAVPHREVARALHFIWQNFTTSIQVDDVANAAGLSRFHLMRLFHTHLGRSINDEITRKRVDRAKELLLQTNLKAWQIAEQCGFSGIVHLSTTFSRIVGQAPSRFRESHPRDE